MISRAPLVGWRWGRFVLGASLLGPRSDDIVHEIALMMFYGAKITDVLELPWYHPTLSEVMLNLARDVESQIDDG